MHPGVVSWVMAVGTPSMMRYFVSGRMSVLTDDGEELEYGPGDFAIMAPGRSGRRATWSRPSPPKLRACCPPAAVSAQDPRAWGRMG